MTDRDRKVQDVSDAVLADLCSALDYVVLERLEGGFARVGNHPLPPWFVRVFIHAQGEGATHVLTDVFPVLDSFLAEADLFWDRFADGRLTSEAFMATDSLGDELAIVATAVGRYGRRYLLMQPDASFTERQRILQSAREQALAHEHVVRQIQELRPPVARLASLLADLTATTPDGASRTTVERMTSQLGTLQRILAELPQRARGASPKPR
jgi:hypothetical protein